jgi:hypothetical protein
MQFVSIASITPTHLLMSGTRGHNLNCINSPAQPLRHYGGAISIFEYRRERVLYPHLARTARVQPLPGVIPCAPQHNVMRRRHGISSGSSAPFRACRESCSVGGPVSAQRHFMPRRARDDTGITETPYQLHQCHPPTSSCQGSPGGERLDMREWVDGRNQRRCLPPQTSQKSPDFSEIDAALCAWHFLPMLRPHKTQPPPSSQTTGSQ